MCQLDWRSARTVSDPFADWLEKAMPYLPDMDSKIEAYEAGGSWGVQEIYPPRPGYATSAGIYDSMFTERAARRIAKLLRRKRPPKDWEATKKILHEEGFTDQDIFAPENI